jgi:hypothetical protein
MTQQKTPVVFGGTEHGTAEKPGGFVVENMAQYKTRLFYGREHGTAEKPGGFWRHRR